MARNEEGEFELILGNRQMVSVFLIMVILLGVFFSMGYIVGRNASTPPVAAVPVAPSASKPIIVENTTRPAPDESASEAAKPSPTGAATPAPPAEAPEATEKPAGNAPAASGDQPKAGESFLQVVATTRPDAEIVSDTLAKKGFHTMVVPVPEAALFRVIVGPLKDAADMAAVRARLEAAGFKNPVVRRY